MASTLREPTARLRSENTTHAAGSDPIPALGSGPHLSTPVPAIRQEATSVKSRVREPMISKIGDTADIAYASHLGTNGSTVSVFDGDLIGKNLFAVSIFPSRTVELDAPPTWRQLFVFMLENSDFVLNPDYALGTWFNEQQRGLHVLDVVICVSDRQVALELGRRFNQWSVFDLRRRRQIVVKHPHSINAASFIEGFATGGAL
jgi:hypothetical protein